MKENPKNSYYAHQEYFLLLPWYVNHSLHDPEMKAVENHLRVCLVCKREVAFLQSFAHTVNNSDALETAAQTSFSILRKRILQSDDNNPVPISEEANRVQEPPQAEPKWYEKLWLNFVSFPQAAMVVMTVLALMIVVPGYHLWDSMHSGSYHTLSSSEPPAFNLNEIRVIFTENSSQQQISEVLASIHGTIVEGPSTNGVYLVRLPYDPDTDQQRVFDALNTLKKNGNVIFAESAYTSLSPADSPRDMTQ